MADLKTNYMGIELKNPIVVGACSLSKRVETVRALEDAGAGALVLKSLFEEQVQLERKEFENEVSQYDALYAEAINLFPQMEYGGSKEHLFWVKEARKAVKMPLIASLNAVNEETWLEYSKQLADTGVDGLELNFYSQPLDPEVSAADIEKRELDIFLKIRGAVKIPLAVKLHPYYTNVFQVAKNFSDAGADGLILFNRLFQPDINIDKVGEQSNFQLSSSADAGLSLRWTALLYNRIKADLISNTGIMTANDAAKAILAGSSSVQVVSTLYKNNVNYISTMLKELDGWMNKKGYSSIEEFRGLASKDKTDDPWGYERAQYIKALLGFD